jgi:uncharacterized protein (TIGR03790 family)
VKIKLFAQSVVCVAAVLFFASPSAFALQPDEILLVVNKNSPDSLRLASEYSQLRLVPAGQVIALDVPNDEEMTFEDYETKVVAPLRSFLSDHQLKDKIKCLLTFYGVPFRITNKHNSPDDDKELLEIRHEEFDAAVQLQTTVEAMESQAQSLDPAFQPGKDNSVPALVARSQAALAAIGKDMAGMTDAGQEQQEFRQLAGQLESLDGEAGMDQRFGPSQRNDPNKTDAQRQAWTALHQRVLDARVEIDRLESLRWDAQSREQLRNESRAHFGVLGLLRVLEAQADYFNTDQTGAALDSELALLWWDYYPRQKWLPNPLGLQFNGKSPSTLMVMRLDGPDPATVDRMMKTSVEVEKTGLQGIVAIDARGIQPIDDKGNLNAFGEFDETLRNLAQIVQSKSQLIVKLDNQEAVFPPHSVKNVALYCGWYSVQNYIPGCDFNPGAVGYHVASYEMITLHTASSRWVRGLLSDGVVATLGAVAEPYLSAFPKPDEFFPLLLTGKLSMAEVYWKTTPMTSWMISFIGDPLYTPYKANPAISVDDLPPGLQRAFQ